MDYPPHFNIFSPPFVIFKKSQIPYKRRGSHYALIILRRNGVNIFFDQSKHSSNFIKEEGHRVKNDD